MGLDKLAQLSIGLAAFIGGLWIVLLIIRSLKEKHGGDNGSSGMKSASFWELKIREIVREEVEDVMAQRNEQIRRMLRDELDRR